MALEVLCAAQDDDEDEEEDEEEDEDEDEEAVHKTVVIRELNHDGSERADTDVGPSVLSALRARLLSC